MAIVTTVVCKPLTRRVPAKGRSVLAHGSAAAAKKSGISETDKAMAEEMTLASPSDAWRRLAPHVGQDHRKLRGAASRMDTKQHRLPCWRSATVVRICLCPAVQFLRARPRELLSEYVSLRRRYWRQHLWAGIMGVGQARMSPMRPGVGQAGSPEPAYM